MLKLTASPMKVLDFDTESRPLSYLGHDFTTSEITAIAAHDGRRMYCWILGETSASAMLDAFRWHYDRADIVTGHYIVRHDLPRINGALLELGMAPLGPKLVSDTYSHLAPIQGVSKSQEALSDMLGLAEPKVYMSQKDWRTANRLQQLELTRNRVESDVRQHMALRSALLDRGLLGPPQSWLP